MKNKIKIIATIIVALIAVFSGLCFAGVINLDNSHKEADVLDSNNQYDYGTTEDAEDDYWEIIYEGMEITPDIKCDAIINDSNTLCFTVDTMWEIEVVLADKGYEEHKGDIATRESSLKENGYSIIQSATISSTASKEYLYIVICGEIITATGENEERYMNIISAAAPDGRRFEVFVNCNPVCINGKSFVDMSYEERLTVYEESIRIVNSLIGDATITDKENASLGTAWYDEDNIEQSENIYISQDILTDNQGKIVATYNLPDNTIFNNEPASTNKSCEKWYTKDQDLYIVTSVDYSYEYDNAREYIEFSANLEDKRVNEICELLVGDRHWYYYTYNTAVVSNDESNLTYYFCAAVDLEDGRIFRIHGRTNKEQLTDIMIYMDIIESL